MAQAKTLTPQEVSKVLHYIDSRSTAQRDRAMFLMTCWSGMRVGEIAALRLGDVLQSDGEIRGEIRLAAEQTKGRHSRTVFVSEKLRAELSLYLAGRTVTQFPTLPLFYTQSGRAFTASSLCQHFYWLYRRAGVPGASSHSGRRTFITNLANKGIGVRVLASLAGHRSIEVTQKYIEVNDDMRRRAVELA
jgi:integrase/recombinase XerD